MKKISNRTYTLHKITDFASVILLVGLLLFIWQLYRGSIALPFLKPYIIRALNHDDSDYQVSLDGVNLELVRSIQPLRIIANNVVYQKDQVITVNAPKVSLSFSLKALLRGIIAPSAIDVDQPQIYIFTHYGVAEKKDIEEVNRKKIEYYLEQAAGFWDHFNSEDNTYPESYINEINISKADVELLEVDLGKKWHFSDVNYSFNRGFSSLETEINALMPFAQSTSSLGVAIKYNYGDEKADFKFYFSDLIPVNLIHLITTDEDSKAFYNIRVPLHGNLSTEINFKELYAYKDKLTDNIEKLIKNIAFELNGEKGVVKFSEDSKYDYEISGLILKGDINGNLNKIKINDASLNFDNQKVVLGLEVNGLKEYILNSALNNLKITLSAKVNELKTNELSRFWPKYFGEKAWQWCHDNLAEGIIKNGNFEFIFGYDKKKKSFGFEDLSGTAEIEGGQLTYLETMPKIVDAYGKAVFTDHNIRIDVHKAKSDDVVVNSGYVDLYDLDKNDNFLKLELKGIGSVTDILNLIDHEPLKYPSSIGINSSDIKGTADVSLGLQFELREDLDPQNIKVNVDAVLHDIAIKKAMMDKQVEAKTLDLTLDNQKMTIFGVVNINGQPINLMWNESFVAKEYQRQYQISFSFDDDFKKMMGLNIAALKQPYIKGAIPTKAVVTTYANGKTIIDAHGNLKGTAIDYGFLGFEKKSGVNAEITAQIDLKGNKIFNVPKFTLTKQDFKLNGMIDFDDKGRISDINITDVKGPKTNAKAKIAFSYVPEENIKVIVSGYSYDLSDFFSRDEEDVETAKKRRKQLKKNDTEKEENDFENAPNMEVNIAVDKLWTNENIHIRNFAGTAKTINKVGIHEIHMVGNFKTDKANSKNSSFLKLDYIPKQNKEYLLSIDSNDAGSTLRFLNIYDYIRGGTLSINAKRDANNRFVGYVKARDFNLVNTGVLAKLLTLASFTGILDMLSGDGIAFTHLDIPFEYQNSVLTLDEAKCFGNVIGISGQGQYNNKYQEFDFKGLIAPAYGLNTFLGKIPVVGSLLSGKDGTVFAANYSITGDIDDPQIDISPLSALSPNSIKELWQDTFDDK